MGLERRQSDRIHAELPIRVSFGGSDETHEGTCLNVGERGMYVRLRVRPRAGEVALVAFQLVPGTRSILASAEVAWVLPDPIGPWEDAGMGLVFRQMLPEDRQLIRRAIERVREARKGSNAGDLPSSRPS